MDIPPLADQQFLMFFDELKCSPFVTTTKSKVVSLSDLSLELNDQYAALMPDMYVHRRMIVCIYLDAKSAFV